MADNTAMVRLKRTTIARLRAMAESIVHAVEQNRREDPGIDPEPINPQSCGLSLDQVVNMLLDARDRHHGRAREQAIRRKTKKEDGDHVAKFFDGMPPEPGPSGPAETLGNLFDRLVDE